MSGGEPARGGEIGGDVVGNRDGGGEEESRLVMITVMVDDQCEEEEERTSSLGTRFYWCALRWGCGR